MRRAGRGPRGPHRPVSAQRLGSARASHRPQRSRDPHCARGCPASVFLFQAEDGIRDRLVTGVQTCALPLTETVKEKFKKEIGQDEEYQGILRKVQEKNQNVDGRVGIDKEGILCWKERLYVPDGFRKEVLHQEHDSRIAGHFGRERTLELITRNFYWSKLEDDVREYCNKCDSCQRTKTPRHAKHGLLHPLELPSSPWTYISVDFITDLPESNGNRNIMVVVDRFTKMAHFIPTDKREASTVARLFLNNVWKYHGMPIDIVSDRDTVFTGHFLADLYQFLGIKRSMSTAFHPQTDGQTERINQNIEHYLRTY